MAKQILKGVGSIVGLAAGPLGSIAGNMIGGLAGDLFGGKKKSATPAPTASAAGPRIMPLADGDAVKAARRKSIATQLGRSGRSSTMLSGDSETLGG